jgi:formyl-CoA transferase
MQAYSGLMAGDRKVDEYGAPDQITATAPADYMAGAAAAMGVCAALFHRERTGEGQYVGSSLLAAGLAMQGTAAGKLPAFDAQVTDPMLARLQAVRERQGSYQEMLEAKGDLLKMMGAAIRLYYGGYQVKDGALILGALTPLNRQQMRRAIGIEDDPTGSPDFDTFAPDAEAITEQMRARIREIMLTKTMDEWLDAFDREGAPVSKVNFPEEIANDPQVQAMGYMLELEHPLTGPERMPGPMVAMEKTPTGTSTTSPPLAWHTDEVLKEHGLTEQEIEELVKAGAISRPGV